MTVLTTADLDRFEEQALDTDPAGLVDFLNACPDIIVAARLQVAVDGLPSPLDQIQPTLGGDPDRVWEAWASTPIGGVVGYGSTMLAAVLSLDAALRARRRGGVGPTP
jgi:hypothetical protein